MGCREDGLPATDGLPLTADAPLQRGEMAKSANKRHLSDGVDSLGKNYSNAKMRFQSFFMLITVQPFFLASSYSAWVKVPTLVSGSPSAGP